MEQSDLKQWEQRCIQEEPPECTAACPLHVDARAFVRHVRDGRWREAWQTLARTMPLAGVLGRICDAPCQARCKRGEVGDAIRIGALERVCVAQAQENYRFTPLPSKGQRIAILGSGLSSLTAAWDLIRKSYGVTLYDAGDRPGAALQAQHAPILSGDSMTAELAWLEKWGVRFEAGAPLPTPSFFQQTVEEFDALYLGLDSIDSDQWPLTRNAEGSLQVDPQIFTTSNPKVFAGGLTSSTILRAAQGRWVATSMDRFLQKVSLTAGREKEGAFATRLFTSLAGVQPLRAVAMADAQSGYSAAEATAEAARCLNCQCLECVKVCPYLEAFGAYPRKYAREIYNNESIVMGTRTANTLINSCSLCGLCQAVCPEDFAMQDLCLQTRRSMVEKGKMPASAHEFALEDMAFSQSDDFFLVRHAPGQKQSSHLFFPGCQLCASSPGQAAALYDYLRTRLGSVGLALGCCGAPAHWAGRREESEKILNLWQKQWEEMGRPQFLLACSACHQMFRELRPQVPIQSVWETLAAVGLPESPNTSPSACLAIHDPCTTREALHLQTAARQVLAAAGIAAEELPLGQELTECCGFGGLMANANPSLAQEVTRRRAALSAHDYLTYCAMCRDRLAAVGKRALHLLDLIFPPAGESDPAARPRPGWSQRRENRARLKQMLLEKVWSEAPVAGANYAKINLMISAEVRKRLDERRILEEDLQQTIARAEAGGPRLRHPVTGRLRAAFRPRHVTFWVEYAPIKEGFEVFNAYCHRMEVKS
ncbi:MAG: 4Fe-4S dicluster domain-containing protein [Desulfobacteraceae bacterium]|nr:4Fe-4S dicluster domain-containing protein [Desulfobacteraceae bacterium]